MKTQSMTLLYLLAIFCESYYSYNKSYIIIGVLIIAHARDSKTNTLTMFSANIKS